MDPIFFESPAEFRRWLEQHHETANEVWLGYHKKSTGRGGLTYPESVDEALCFGWIDGVRRSLDDERYVNRFTPRRRGSNWSVVNVRRVEGLIRAGRMHLAGMQAFEARTAAKTGVYTFEQDGEPVLAPEDEARFRANTDAWRFFESQPPGYRRTALRWALSAKREETRARRIDTLIEDSAAGRRIALLRRNGE